MISLNNIKKSFGSNFNLQIDYLHIAPSQTFVVIGPSGCGKSTLLRLIMYLTQPDFGTVQILGTAMTLGSCRFLRQKMGYVTQEGGLFPHMTARENVIFMARCLQKDPLWIDGRFKELCELVELTSGDLKRYPIELSGGQRRKVSLVRALMLDPAIVLLDEPLGALDPLIRIRLRRDLKRIFNFLKKTIVFVTHDMAEAAFFGHEILLMRDGSSIQRGSLDDLLERPSDPFVSEFILAQKSDWVELATR